MENSIDWDRQWALHAADFRDGCAHINLSSYGTAQTIRLLPGAGFGDLSHPTTRLVLKLMAPHVKKKVFLDIGCGSGILSLSAIAMGASFSYGIDIDLPSLEHAEKNGRLNRQEQKLSFQTPDQISFFPSPIIVGMNMISSEQKLAWAFHQKFSSQISLLITSGILKEEDATYRSLTESWGWKLIHEEEEEKWKGYMFTLEQS